MSELRKTADVIYELESERRFGMGDHRTGHLAIGDYGLAVSDDVYNPSTHDMVDIDMHESVIARHYVVNEVMPERPLQVAVLVDETSRDEPEFFTRHKAAARLLLAQDLAQSSPTLDTVETMHFNDDNHRGAILAQAERRSADGELVFVLSDFIGMPRNETAQRSPFVAVQIEHLLQSNVPKMNVGRIAYQGASEVNTQNSIEFIRERFVRSHDNRRAVIESFGGRIAAVGVGAAPFYARYDRPYDMDETDDRIAQAIVQANGKA